MRTDDIVPNIVHIKQIGRAFFDSYPPTFCTIIPPNMHPSVGAVMETTEKTVFTNATGKLKTVTK